MKKLVSKTQIKKAEQTVAKLPLPKISSNVWWNIAILVGGLILLVWAFNEALEALGLREDSSDRKAREKLQEDTLELLEKSTGQRPNFTDFQYQQWADSAHEGMRFSNVGDDDDLVVEAAEHMMNDADVVKWATAYGKRQLHYFGLPDGPSKTLFAAIASDVKSKNRNKINSNWKSKNIKFKV